jgi:hypothetical protein
MDIYKALDQKGIIIQNLRTGKELSCDQGKWYVWKRKLRGKDELILETISEKSAIQELLR